jgi:hypothetical protein
MLVECELLEHLICDMRVPRFDICRHICVSDLYFVNIALTDNFYVFFGGKLPQFLYLFNLFQLIFCQF